MQKQLRSEQPAMQASLFLCLLTSAVLTVAGSAAGQVVNYSGSHDLVTSDGVSVYAERENGVPLYVEGALLEPVTDGNYVEAAMRFFESNVSAYRMIDPIAELQVRGTTFDDLKMHHIRFNQFHQGVRVFGAELVVHFDAQGVLRTVNGNYVPEISLNVTPTISASDVVGFADRDLRSFFGQGQLHGEPELIVFPWQGENYLCWRILLACDRPVGDWEYFVEANTGQVIYKANRIMNVNDVGIGNGVMGAARNHIDTDQNPATLLFDMIDRTRRANNNPHGHDGQMTATAVIQTNMAGASLPGTVASDADNVWNDSDNQRAAVDAHVYSALVYDWYLSEFGRNSYDNTGVSMNISVNYSAEGDNNAFWSPLLQRVAVWSWGTDAWLVAYRSLAACPDVIAHEWSHAVTGATSGLIYEREPGALNEAYSDMMGAAFEFAHAAWDAPDWLIGENGFIANGHFRDMQNPKNPGHPAFLPLPDYYGLWDPDWIDVIGCTPTEPNDWCGVHTNCGVGDKWFYLLSDGDIHNGITVTGIGVANAARIAYRANTIFWTVQTGYYEAALATVTAADDLDPTGAWAQQVINAWRAVGVFSGGYVLLIDVSGSMANQVTGGVQTRWEVARQRAREDVADIFNMDQNAQVQVMTFTGSGTLQAVNSVPVISVRQGFTNTIIDVINAIDNIDQPMGWTPLAQALSEAADALVTAPFPDVRHLIIYTDGDENSSDHDQAWSVCGVCNGDLSAPPDVLPADWLDGCDPDNSMANPCTQYQLCLATQLSNNGIVNVRYFGEEITKSGLPFKHESDRATPALFAAESKTPDGDLADGGNKAVALDYRFLKALADMSRGWFSVEQGEPLPAINIEKTHNTFQGLHETVDVTNDIADIEMGGFDFLIAYDASALALQSALPGPAFYEPAPDGCGWEYFTYRHGPFGNCGDACPSGMVRVFGLAETNNGANHPSCFLPDSLPATLFTMDFIVSNDRTLECQYIPIWFFWTDCGDNSISSVDGEILYVSDHVYDFEGTDITDSTYGFPTYFGVQPECLNPDPDKPTAIQWIDFVNGGIDIVCADSIDARGDINLNGVPWEIADAVLYSNYFVRGIGVFTVNQQGQIAASDCNADGITLSVADLVYMIQIIVGSRPIPPRPPYSPPPSKLAPVAAGIHFENGVLSVDAEVAAAFVKVDGKVEPILLADNMELKYGYDADARATRILVYSMKPDRVFSGDFLGGIEGSVITLEMAIYDGAPVTVKLVPDEFALYPCYPNPFNPFTTISFALASSVDYELVIYNALGQTVETFNGHSGPGLERIDWNATRFASGVYFYRLMAGDFTDTRKMVLLK